MTYFLQCWAGVLCRVLAALGVLCALPAAASHFRFGNLSWAPTGNPGEVEFRLTLAIRRDDAFNGLFPGGVDQYAETGDIVTNQLGAITFAFGDGQISPVLPMVITAFSVTENWVLGEALDPTTGQRGIRHRYLSEGPFLAGLDECCRLQATSLNNRANGQYRLLTPVRPYTGNHSPICSLLPIMTLPEGPAATFTVPALDPDGDGLRFRLATDAEAGGGAGPPNLSIDPGSGVVTWNNQGLDTNRFWTAQIVVEDTDANGAIKTASPVDFLLRINPSSRISPICQIDPPGPFHVTTGQTVSLTVSGSDADPGDTLVLNTSGLPDGATMTPALPVAGDASGVSSRFEWTPGAGQEGMYQVLYGIVDSFGRQTVCGVIVNVTAPIPIADLAVSKVVNSPNASLGDIVEYTLAITNLGPEPAYSVVLTDVLPPGITNLVFTPSRGGCTNMGGSIECSLGLLQTNDGALVSIVGSVTAIGLLTNVVTVRSAAMDPNPTNSQASALVSVSIPPPIDCLTNPATIVDLSNWTQIQYDFVGGQLDALWVLSDTNTVATQTVNADASILLSPFVLANDEMRGTWRVNDNIDDDFIGFVFGYQDSTHYYLFDWKQADQLRFGAFAERGMSVKVIDTTNALTGADLHGTTNTSGNVRLLYHNTLAYNDFTDYGFQLQFQPGQFSITVTQGLTVLASFTLNDATYTNGQFGFYSFSQDQVRYSAFTNSLYAPRPLVQASSPSVVEGQTGTTHLSFAVSLSTANCNVTSVDYDVAPGTATPNVDYQSVPAGTLFFPPGVTNLFVTVPVVGDRDIEMDETLFLRLSSVVNGTLGATQYTGTIVNDDSNALPVVTFLAPAPDPCLTLPTNLLLVADAQDSDGSISRIQFWRNGTNLLGEVFSPPYELLWTNVPAGTSFLTASAWDDRDARGTSAPVVVTASALSVLTVSDVRVPEGGAGGVAQFVVTLLPSTCRTVSVDVATVDGSALAGLDYGPVMGRLVFAPGEAAQSVSVPVLMDGLLESNEMFGLCLSNADGAVIATSCAIGTIVDGNFPELRCPGPLTTNIQPGVCGAYVSFDVFASGVTGECACVTVVCNPHSGSLFPPGSNIVHCTATASSGNAVDCSFPVEVVARPEAPMIQISYPVWEGETRSNQARVCMSTAFENGRIFFTQDGSPPSGISAIYTNCFDLFYEAAFPEPQRIILSAVAYSSNGMDSAFSCPVEVILLPYCDGKFKLLTKSANDGGGEVRREPVREKYPCGTRVHVTAVPAAGWTFMGWLGDVPGSAPGSAQVVMLRDKCAEGVFGTGLRTNVVGNGSLRVEPAASLYPYGTQISIFAVPQPGHYFAHWTNLLGVDVLPNTRTANPFRQRIVDAMPSLTAVFLPLPGGNHTLNVFVDGFGVVSSSPASNRYASGILVTNRVTPAPGQTFSGWSGDVSGQVSPLVLNMDRNWFITANFSKRPQLDLFHCEGKLAGDVFQLLLDGELGGVFLLEATDQLGPAAAWMPVGLLTNSLGRVQYDDPYPRPPGRRFYRASVIE